MPTRNRAQYVLQSVKYFQRQDYPNLELLILDDGSEDVSSMVASDKRIRYVRIHSAVTIGAKRNLGCKLAQGDIIAHWDDDDWYGASRITLQAAPLLDGSADITAFSDCIFFEIEKWKFWRCSSKIFQRMFVGNVHGGTLVYRRTLFQSGIRYPDLSLGEDAMFLYLCHRRGARVTGISSEGLFIYLRHEHSTWQFDCGEHIIPSAWQRIDEPKLSYEDRLFFLSQSPHAQAVSL